MEESENMPEERQRRFWGALAGHVISHVLGDETASPDAESTAENLHNTYAAMPEKRQRRFWHQLAASAAHSPSSMDLQKDLWNRLLGDETASPDAESTAENLHNAYAAMPEHRQRRFWHQLAASAAHSVVNHYLG